MLACQSALHIIRGKDLQDCFSLISLLRSSLSMKEGYLVSTVVARNLPEIVIMGQSAACWLPWPARAACTGNSFKSGNQLSKSCVFTNMQEAFLVGLTMLLGRSHIAGSSLGVTEGIWCLLWRHTCHTLSFMWSLKRSSAENRAGWRGYCTDVRAFLHCCCSYLQAALCFDHTLAVAFRQIYWIYWIIGLFINFHVVK